MFQMQRRFQIIPCCSLLLSPNLSISIPNPGTLVSFISEVLCLLEHKVLYNIPKSIHLLFTIFKTDQQRNNSRENEETERKQKQHPVVDVTGDGSKVQCCKAILHRNLECQVHESRQTGSGQTGDDKSERQHSRNQLTKMDWNV